MVFVVSTYNSYLRRPEGGFLGLPSRPSRGVPWRSKAGIYAPRADATLVPTLVLHHCANARARRHHSGYGAAASTEVGAGDVPEARTSRPTPCACVREEYVCGAGEGREGVPGG